MTTPTKCPYNSKSPYVLLDFRDTNYGEQKIYKRQSCATSSTGWLCDRCREDRDDARFTKLAAALAGKK